jgi:hypothetical protein
MLYQAYQAHSDIMVPVRAFAGAAATIGPSGLPLARDLNAIYGAPEELAESNRWKSGPGKVVAGRPVASVA